MIINRTPGKFIFKNKRIFNVFGPTDGIKSRLYEKSFLWPLLNKLIQEKPNNDFKPFVHNILPLIQFLFRQ